MAIEWSLVQSAITAVAGLGGVWLGGRLTWEREEKRERARELKEATYLAILVVAHLERFADSCLTVAFDDGTEEGRPAGSLGCWEPTVTPPIFDPLSFDVNWKALPSDLMYDILGMPYRIEQLEHDIAKVYEDDGPPDYTEYFWERRRGWAVLGLEGTVKNKAVYLALGIRADGRKEVLGLWIEQTEGAKFWLKVFNELKNRGLEDILIAVVDGLRGFPEAIEAVYPHAQIQTCIVHLIRNSTTLASWKDRKELAAALKPVYQAVNADAAEAALDAFAAGPWGTKFPTVAAMWRRQWQQVIPFFAYPPEVRTIIYTTNAIESLHMRLRKIVKNRGHFPSDDAATELLFLALRNIEKDWKMAPRTWKLAANQFAIMFGERFTNAIT